MNGFVSRVCVVGMLAASGCGRTGLYVTDATPAGDSASEASMPVLDPTLDSHESYALSYWRLHVLDRRGGLHTLAWPLDLPRSGSVVWRRIATPFSLRTVRAAGFAYAVGGVSEMGQTWFGPHNPGYPEYFRPEYAAEDVNAMRDIADLALDGVVGCVLNRLGEVHCWKHSHFALDSDERSIRLHRVPLPSRARSIVVRDTLSNLNMTYEACAILENEDVVCWGNQNELILQAMVGHRQDYRVLAVPLASMELLHGSVQLAMGPGIVCGRRGDASVVCGTFEDESRLRWPDLRIHMAEPSVAVWGGHSEICSQRTDMRLVCWGGGIAPPPSETGVRLRPHYPSIEPPLMGAYPRVIYVSDIRSVRVVVSDGGNIFYRGVGISDSSYYEEFQGLERPD